MSKVLHLTIASVDEVFFSGDVESASFPGIAGDFQVLPQHEPLITTLKEGEVRYVVSGETRLQKVDQGVVEIAHNHCSVLL